MGNYWKNKSQPQTTQPLIQVLPFSFDPKFVIKDEWKESDYGQKGKRLLNNKIRKSQYTIATLKEKYKFPIRNQNSQGVWRLIRYKDGKFVQHSDRQQSAQHIGTQILIFPKSKSRHQKGQLIIFKSQNKSQPIRVEAHEQFYTYVYIPLGCAHQITQVTGERTVATRMVDKQYKIEKNEQELYNSPEFGRFDRSRLKPGYDD